MAINEATLEARIDRILTSVFPTFKTVKVEHQKSFSIKFGHHNVTVDLKEPSAKSTKAIFDILLTVDNQNIILLELKKEGLRLNDDDIEQGISYARLIHPMPPLTLISNGVDNLFFDTYTKERSDITVVDMDLIKRKIDNSFTLATNDFKNAINTLLNNEPEIFSQVINGISAERFNRYFGEIEDFDKAICPDFLIKRKVISKILNHFADNENLVGVIGHAFSGKTNLLYEFFTKTRDNNNFLLFIDCNGEYYSILQQMANQFTKHIKTLVDKEKIREWLLLSLVNLPHCNFYLLLDNFNNEIPESMKSDIIELIEIFKDNNQHILYTIDEFNYTQIAKVRNRQYKTLIGEQSKIVKLDELDDDEYQAVNDLMLLNHKIRIEHGGHFATEYRQPRILRHLCSLYQGTSEEDRFCIIPSVPDLELLCAIAQNNTYSKEIHDLYKKITFCFLEEDELRKENPELYTMAFGSGAITKDIFMKYYPDDYKSLVESSVIVLREISDGLTVIYPKIHELVASQSITLIADKIIHLRHTGTDIDQIYALLLQAVAPIPYSDIVATGALFKIMEKKEYDLFTKIIFNLIKTPPHLEKVNAGTQILMYAEDVGHININIKDEMEESSMMVNFLPYSILSYLTGYPLLTIAEDEEAPPLAFHEALLEKIGSVKHFLCRVDPSSLRNMRHYDYHVWEGVGEFTCITEGVIEPIVRSIQKCFLALPILIEELFDKAEEDNNFILLHRINLAIREYIGYTEPELSEKAKCLVTRFNNYFKGFISDYFTRHIEDSEKREIEKKKWLSLMDSH